MRKSCVLVAILSGTIAAACADHTATSMNEVAQRGAWGSADASLVAADTGATIQFLAGNCYGSYGNITQAIPAGAFALSGVFTQLMGVYPGRIEYAAQFSGTVDGNRMTLTVTIPSLSRVLGPFVLAYGVHNAWSQCFYP